MLTVKWSSYRPGMAQRVSRGIALLFHDRGTRRGWVVSSTARPHFTPAKTRYPFYRRLGGPQGWPGRAEILVPAGIRSRTVQPVVSRYTDWATGSTYYHVPFKIMINYRCIKQVLPFAETLHCLHFTLFWKYIFVCIIWGTAVAQWLSSVLQVGRSLVRSKLVSVDF